MNESSNFPIFESRIVQRSIRAVGALAVAASLSLIPSAAHADGGENLHIPVEVSVVTEESALAIVDSEPTNIPAVETFAETTLSGITEPTVEAFAMPTPTQVEAIDVDDSGMLPETPEELYVAPEQSPEPTPTPTQVEAIDVDDSGMLPETPEELYVAPEQSPEPTPTPTQVEAIDVDDSGMLPETPEELYVAPEAPTTDATTEAPTNNDEINTLANTGAPIVPVVLAGASLIGAGAGLTAASKRR